MRSGRREPAQPFRRDGARRGEALTGSPVGTCSARSPVPFLCPVFLARGLLRRDRGDVAGSPPRGRIGFGPPTVRRTRRRDRSAVAVVGRSRIAHPFRFERSCGALVVATSSAFRHWPVQSGEAVVSGLQPSLDSRVWLGDSSSSLPGAMSYVGESGSRPTGSASPSWRPVCPRILVPEHASPVGDVETRFRRRAPALTTPEMSLTWPLPAGGSPSTSVVITFTSQAAPRVRFGHASMPITRDGRTCGVRAPAATLGSVSKRSDPHWAFLVRSERGRVTSQLTSRYPRRATGGGGGVSNR